MATNTSLKQHDQAQYVILPTNPHGLSSQPAMRQRFGYGELHTYDEDWHPSKVLTFLMMRKEMVLDTLVY